MALTLSTAAKNGSVDGVTALVDGGTTNATGDIVIKDASSNILVTIDLQNPAFATAASGSASANGLPLSGTVSVAGTAASFDLRDRDNAVVFSGTVTATGGGGDMELSNTTLAVNDTVSLNSFNVSQP